MSCLRMLRLAVCGLALLLSVCVTTAGVTGCSGATASAPTPTPVVMPGMLAVAAATATVGQAAGSVAVQVSRAGGTSGVVSVSYATVDGTAVGGTDYAKSSGTLTWADGDASSKTITVALTVSPAFVGTRTFSVALTGPTGGATLATPAAEIISITGSGSAGSVGLASGSLGVMQTAGTLAVSFTRTGGSTGAVSANYSTTDGTAVAGSDYTKASGSVTWADGDATAKVVNIAVSKTTYFAGTKAFLVSVTGTTGGATAGTSAATVTITGGLLPPTNYFTFSGPTYTWKLGLPIDQYGGTGGTGGIQYAATEASNAQINAGFVDAFFYADTAIYGGTTNHVVFTAPSNGASTTPGSGSDHTRSELRELYNGAGADSNGDWTSAIGGTLTASCVVNSVSVNSDEATIGQIHNQSYVFALLIYRPAQKDIAFDVYSSYGSSSHVRTSMVQNVSLGTTISYSINYKGNSIVVTVNGVTQTFAVDASWAGTPMYFKMGAYHAAPNTGNPAGDQTQVAFGSFAVTH